jgi:predicted alpha/beta superfamily hydrolase
MKPTFTLPSPETLTEYVITVQSPRTPASAAPWPAVLVLDGDDQFSAAAAAAREREQTGAAPALLLIGVGYGASYRDSANRRGRDYTPTAHSDEPSSGGAAPFHRFLESTLWPELARRYPIDPQKRAIAGHSLGALFVLYALFRERPFFSHFLASAPSIWWDNRSLLRLAADRRSQNDGLPAHVFLSVGAEDTESMTGDLGLLEHQLAERPFRGLRVIRQRFAGRNHYDVLPDAYRAGLAALFPSSTPV